MTQITTTLYDSIATSYANAYEQMQLISGEIEDALHTLVDVTTGGYIPDDDDAAVEIELALLTPLNSAANSIGNLTRSTSSLLQAVRAINNHVIDNATADYGTTATDKLTYWVNTRMISEWPNGAPQGWYELSQDAGYTVDEAGNEWNYHS
jgi:hypothetical protein